MLTHAHTDHGQGLKKIIQEFGTKYFFYPQSNDYSALALLIKYVIRKNSRVDEYELVDQNMKLPDLGDVKMKIFWPPPNYHTKNKNENNNSVVLSLEHGAIYFLLTGDAEAKVWNKIAINIPPTTKMFKIPHHGSFNGTFNSSGKTPWLDKCPTDSFLAISAHNIPFGHPDKEVIDKLNKDKWTYYRTDEQYHLTFTSDGTNVKVKYSHI